MKIVFQSVFTLIILVIGVWLFIVVPTPTNLLKGLGVAALFVYPLAIAFYVSVVGVLGVSIWNLIAFIFKEEQYDETSNTTETSNNKKYNYQPHLNVQIEDLNTVDSDTKTSEKTTIGIQKKNTSLLFSTFKIGGLIVGGSFASAFLILAFFAYILKSNSNDREMKTYSILYEAEDYNDSRIKYYIRELDVNSQKLIASDNIYDDVVANMKRGIALECIKVFRKEHNATKKYQADMQIENFMLNARNRSATTDDMRELSIKKEKFLRYNHTRSEYGLSNPSLKLQESCQKTIPVNTILKKVMPVYIQYEEKKLEDARTYALIYSTSSKYLTSQEKWVNILHKKYPKDMHSKGD